MKKSQSSDYFNRLEKTLAIDDEGNATFAKSVLADGTIGSNSGLKAIAVYQFASGKLTDYGKFEENTDLSILGLKDYEGNYESIGLGSLSLENQQLVAFSMTGYDFYNDDILFFSLNNDGTISISMYAKSIDTQPKIYNHTLTLTADKSYTLIYQSTIEASVNSIASLRMIMNVKSPNDNIILPVCATDLSTTAVLQVTTALCKVGAANVTTISDKVTQL